MLRLRTTRYAVNHTAPPPKEGEGELGKGRKHRRERSAYRVRRSTVFLPRKPTTELAALFESSAKCRHRLAFMPRSKWMVSLTRHRDAEAFVGVYVMVGVLGVLTEFDLDPRDLAVESAGVGGVVRADQGAGLAADVSGLIGGEDASWAWSTRPVPTSLPSS